MTQKEIKSVAGADYDSLEEITRESLDGAFERYEEVVKRIADFVTKTVVMPLHERHGWGYASGWGDWYFVINGQCVNRDSHNMIVPVEIRAADEVLSLLIPGMRSNTIGSFIKDLPEREDPNGDL